jgi:hypothetical protein
MAAAIAHYRQAASASSPSGLSAQDAVVRIDLPQNPAAYLQMRSGLDNNGQLQFELANPTRLDVADIGVTVRYIDTSGQTQTVRRTIYGTLAANSRQQYQTGLVPATGEQAYEILLESARVIPAD